MGYEVPVHAFSTDPELLDPFRERGFVDGTLPEPGTPAVPLEDLLPLFAELLTGAAQ